MTTNYNRILIVNLCTFLILAGCAQTRQVDVDYPGGASVDPKSDQPNTSHTFQALPGFQVIDGDDYYVRLVSEFDFNGENSLKNDCSSLTPNFKKNDLSSALIFNVQNARLKFKNEAPGYSYQTMGGDCNYKFDAKKLNLTPWMRLDVGKETSVDYSVYSSANSDVDVTSLVNKVTAASSLLAFTGVGMGVAVLGQVAGQWYNTQHAQTPPQPTPAAKHSTQSRSLPPFVRYAGKQGTLTDTVFKVHVVAEGGVNILGPESLSFGELKLTPELTPSLLLKTKDNGVPDARDLSLSEISLTPVKSATGDINLQQLIEQSKHPEKPNLKPDWAKYDDVQTHCRKLKVTMKDLGFNKFDRNAYVYYFLANSSDWLNYNLPAQKLQGDDISAKTLQQYRSKNFSGCLSDDDFTAMKAMGLPVNTESDWAKLGDASSKKEQLFVPLKSIERQLLAVLKNPDKAEMESQLFPLLNTASKGDGTVLLQNRLGEFGLGKLLQADVTAPNPLSTNPVKPAPSALSDATASKDKPAQDKPPVATPPVSPTITIPGAGLIVDAHQLTQVFAGLMINELSCARLIPEQIGKPTANTGILLFTTIAGSPRAKGGAMEFEFTGGKINRIAFQTPSYRDFEQDITDHPEVGGCRIDAGLLTKLH